jgi:hypothetical protein
MAGRPASGTKSDRIASASIAISRSEMELLSPTVLVGRLVAGGVSRLTAERFVAIQRGTAEAGRARPHLLSRR